MLFFVCYLLLIRQMRSYWKFEANAARESSASCPLDFVWCEQGRRLHSSNALKVLTWLIVVPCINMVGKHERLVFNNLQKDTPPVISMNSCSKCWDWKHQVSIPKRLCTCHRCACLAHGSIRSNWCARFAGCAFHKSRSFFTVADTRTPKYNRCSACICAAT